MGQAFDIDRIPGDGASLGDRPAAIYLGLRLKSGVIVSREDDHGKVSGLPMRHDLRRHSHGFEWGYGGSGPAQLALAILTDSIGEADAITCYQKFKFEVVCRFEADQWAISRDEVISWFRAFRARSGPDIASNSGDL